MRALRTNLLGTAARAAALLAPLAAAPLVAAPLLLATPLAAAPAVTQRYQHVLLISVDGMHAADLANYIRAHPASNFARLSRSGIVYPNAFTTAPSDSYPGMVAQVTGASPKTAGLFYDDSYDRDEYPSANSYLSQGLADPGCAGAPGTEVTNTEALDKTYGFATGLVTDITAGGTIGKVLTQLDPANMQRHVVAGRCVPVYPHEYMRANTIFEVIRASGRYTAWSDKHPAYENLSGPSGTGLSELYAPEINAQDTLDPGAAAGDDFTKSFTGVRSYDSLKVRAVLNWIDGYDGAGTRRLAHVPAIFGMNFQSVSVGQKLAKAGHADAATPTLTGGYLDGNATPGTALSVQLAFVDASIGRFRHELTRQGLDDTLIIISAKHGQSPIDGRDRVAISDAPFAQVPGFGTHGFEICDDVGLVWLEPDLQRANYAAARAYLLAHAAELHILELLDRASLTPLYGSPLASSRVPDFVAVTEHGAICTGGSKLSEHGGFSSDDRNVALLVSAPDIRPQVVEALTYTTQIAPTILHALGLDPNALDGVRAEGTPVLGR